MRNLLLPVVAACAFGQPVIASQLMPDVFAKSFCAARLNGYSQQSSIELAVRLSMNVSMPDLPMVNGVRLDTFAATHAAYTRCPQLFEDSPATIY